MSIKYHGPKLEKKVHPLSERLLSLGIMGARPLKPLQDHSAMVLGSVRGALNVDLIILRDYFIDCMIYFIGF